MKIKGNEEAFVCTGLRGFSYSFKEFDYSSVQGQNLEGGVTSTTMTHT